MSIYYTGFYLNRVPTGFGFSTGVALVNSGNSPIEYRIKISDTTLTGITASDVNGGEVPNKTIFISESLDNDVSDDEYLTQIVNQNDSGVFYILHKPFSNYSLSPPNGKHTGHETARITIESLSSFNDVDEDILIDVSGQRVFIQPEPKRIGKFYAVTDFKPDSRVGIEYNWSVLDSDSYLTGFRIETFSDSSFTTPVTIDTYEIKKNINENEPLYGKYDSFKGEDYIIKPTGLEINQNYYARISGLNVDNSGSITFVTGFTTYNPVLDDTAYSGLTPSPGSNLKFTPRILYIDKVSDYEEDFDLFKLLYENNNNSVNFTKYSGVVVKFYPLRTDLATYKGMRGTKKGAINFITPVDKDIVFSVNANNIFTIQLEFENIGLYAFGGSPQYFYNGQYINPNDGGPIFNLDHVEYSDGKKINYLVYKDCDSVFMAGAAGGQMWLVTDNTNEDKREIIIPGSTIEYLIDIDLRQINP